MKKLVCLLLILSTVFCLFCACGGSKDTYKDDVSPTTLIDKLTAALPQADGYDTGAADADYYAFYFNSDPAIDAYAFAFSSSSSDVSEMGVLHVTKEEDVEHVKTLAENYITAQKSFYGSFAQTYNASEMDKLDAAAVHVCGHYVLFTILTKKDTQTALDIVQKTLR